MIDPNIVNRQPCVTPPDYAVNFLKALCDEYDMPTPIIHWMMCEADGETGGWYVHNRGEIYIVANGNPKCDLHSIAHEFAHYITEEGHGSAMYATLLDITDRFQMDYDYMAAIEAVYQPKHLIYGIIKRGF